MAFRVGQHVKICEEYSDVRFRGARGTVTDIHKHGPYDPLEATLVEILLHRNGEKRGVYADRLRHVVYGPEPNGPPRGNFQAIQALGVVLKQETPKAMQNIIRDLSRW